MSWIKKKWERKLPSIGKSSGKGDKTNLASYIRLFESLVIKALKLYTITSSVDLQCHVLQLLAQLVQLRVNYCLLDSEQIFIGFILKQFEYIEGGQVQLAKRLIPPIFHFLVLLSYERYHSKSIINVPKIIQLCDGIIASGQPAMTHAIPSLMPIVEDLFLVRGTYHKSDAGKELDTQREVMVSMLFRFVHYYQVLEIFILILQQNFKESEERWKKLSRQIVDTLLPLLGHQQVNLDHRIALDVVHRLFDAVAPLVFRPVDLLLCTLLGPPHDLSTQSGLQRWMSLVLVMIRVLMVQSKEEVILGRLAELNLSVNVFTDTQNWHKRRREGLSLSETVIHPNEGISLLVKSFPPEEIFARFLLQVVGIVVSEIQTLSFIPAVNTTETHFLCEQLAHLLLYMSHMFQSGFFRRVVNVSMAMVKTDQETNPRYFSVTKINEAFLDLAVVHPTLTLQWCNILILLNFDNQSFWSCVLRPSSSTCASNLLARPLVINSNPGDLSVGKPSTCFNKELVHKGGLILFCDYICENLTDAEHMTWLIVNHINEVIEMCSEPPINDLISNIHRSPAASGLFIQAINTRCENLDMPATARKTLNCLEAIHISQTGQLLILLIKRLLPTPHLTIARATASMACRRVEILLTERSNETCFQLSLEEIDRMLETIYSHKLAKKYSQLVILLFKLRQQWFPNSDSLSLHLSDQEQYNVNLSLKNIDKVAFLKFAQQCCHDIQAQRHCVHMLAALEYNSLLEIMTSKEFNLSLLDECMHYGANLFLNQEKDGSVQESPLSPLPHTVGGLALFTAAKFALFQNIEHLLALIPSPSFIYNPSGFSFTTRETKYALQIQDLFNDSSFLEILQQMVPIVAQYLQLFQKHGAFMDLSIEAMVHLCRFTVLILEAIHWMLCNNKIPTPILLRDVLRSISVILQNPHLVSILNQSENMIWEFTIIHSIHCIFINLHQSGDEKNLKTPAVPNCLLVDSDRHHFAQICPCINKMVMWIEHNRNLTSSVPKFMSELLFPIIIGLSRLPIVNSYVRTPPRAWDLGWTPEVVESIKLSSIPPVPVDLLKDQEVLSQFISRVNLLGWTNRQQFEETWMALLGVLNAIPTLESSGSVDEVEAVHTTCLAIKCMTSLLLQSLLLPQPGNPCNSHYLYQPSEKPVAYLHTRHGKKFPRVWNIVEGRRRNIIGENEWKANSEDNSWRLPCVTSSTMLHTNTYGPNQVSLEYLQLVIGRSGESFTHNLASYDERETYLKMSGLDLHSCLHFLLDLYSQWLSPTNNTSVQLGILTEVVRSVVMLCDIFTERAQFEWMRDTLIARHRTHPIEDEILMQYLVFGISKVVAVLGMDVELIENVHKVIEQSFKSTFLSTRIMALHGVMYLLELGVNDVTQPILPILSDYLLQHLKNSHLPYGHSEQHTLCMWTVVFYLLENLREHVAEEEFFMSVIQLALDTLKCSDDVSYLIQLRIIFGLERLVLANVIYGKGLEPVVKCAVNRFCLPNSFVSLVSLGLLLSCFYAGKDNEMWKLEDLMVSGSSQQFHPTESEPLLATMEKVSTLFHRLKTGYPCEAETIANVLPFLMTDHFPLSEIMNKVIIEFISNQQPFPHLLAAIVFQVFDWAYQQGKSQLVQEWVLLSLSNFTQQSSISMAVWSLTCFFISASTNPWIRAFFPYIQQRMGKLEVQDVEMFCMAGVDFYHQLQNEPDCKAFSAIISSIAVADSPYMKLLDAL